MTVVRRPRIGLIVPADAERIVEEACRVLEQVGIRVDNQEAAGLLRAAGARLQEGRYQLAEKLVRDLLAGVPNQVQLYDRAGDLALTLAGNRVHFNPGSAAIHVLDREDGRRRPATTRDVIELVRLVQDLPNFSAQSTALIASDVPEEISDSYRLYLALRCGTKPIVTGTFSKAGFGPMREMLAVFRESGSDLRERPLAVFDCCPSPPLRWSDLTCQSLIDCARSGIPVELVSMPLAGANAPVTLLDAVVQHTAENLSGIAIHQLACGGSPVIYGGAPSAFDMRFGSTPMGAIETMMISMAYVQVGKHLDLPTHGYLGLSDAKTADYQAGMESGIGAVLAALSGINLISGPGILDYILTQSPEKLLLDHEACGMALRLTRGLARREEGALDLIRELVRKGEFLSHRHTRKYWREELSIASSLIDRKSYGDWLAEGSQTARQRALKEVVRRLSAARDETPSEPAHTELVSIMEAEAVRCGLDSLPE